MKIAGGGPGRLQGRELARAASDIKQLSLLRLKLLPCQDARSRRSASFPISSASD